MSCEESASPVSMKFVWIDDPWFSTVPWIWSACATNIQSHPSDIYIYICIYSKSPKIFRSKKTLIHLTLLICNSVWGIMDGRMCFHLAEITCTSPTFDTTAQLRWISPFGVHSGSHTSVIEATFQGGWPYSAESLKGSPTIPYPKCLLPLHSLGTVRKR